MQQATYYKKNVYGNTLMYPVNEHAKAICSIAGTASISHRDMELSKVLGFEWVEVLESSIL